MLFCGQEVSLIPPRFPHTVVAQLARKPRCLMAPNHLATTSTSCLGSCPESLPSVVDCINACDADAQCQIYTYNPLAQTCSRCVCWQWPAVCKDALPGHAGTSCSLRRLGAKEAPHGGVRILGGRACSAWAGCPAVLVA
jgi:hypothetical protein